VQSRLELRLLGTLVHQAMRELGRSIAWRAKMIWGWGRGQGRSPGAINRRSHLTVCVELRDIRRDGRPRSIPL